MLLNEMRDLFGKPVVSKEDTLRMDSIRAAAVWRNQDSVPKRLLTISFGQQIHASFLIAAACLTTNAHWNW